MQTKQEMFDALLQDLTRTSREIIGAAVVAPDGMVIAGHFYGLQGKMESAGAMAALILSLGEQVTNVLQAGGMQEIILRAQKDYILVFTLERRAALILQATAQATLGQLLLRARQATPKISALI